MFGLVLILGLALLGAVLTMAMAEPQIVGPQDTLLQLQTLVTKTASFNGTALDQGAGFAPGGPGVSVAANIRVSALDTTSGDEVYTFTVEDSPDNATFSVRATGKATAAGAMAVGGFVKQRYVRLSLTAAGTTPSITYEAYLNPLPS